MNHHLYRRQPLRFHSVRHSWFRLSLYVVSFYFVVSTLLLAYISKYNREQQQHTESNKIIFFVWQSQAEKINRVAPTSLKVEYIYIDLTEIRFHWRPNSNPPSLQHKKNNNNRISSSDSTLYFLVVDWQRCWLLRKKRAIYLTHSIFVICSH